MALIAGAAGFALLLVVGLLIFALTRHHGSDDASGGSDSSSAEPEMSEDSSQPQTKPVVDYFNALQKGDVEGIKKAAPLPSSASDAALTAAVLKGAKDRVHNVKITDPGSSSLGTTSVSVAYDIKGRTYSDDFYVNKNSGDWQMSNNSMPTVTLDTSTPDITVNGQKVTLDISDSSYTYLALPPGSYTIGVGGSKYLSAVSKDVTVSGDSFSSSHITLEPTMTAAATKDAQKQVNAFVRKCVKDPSASTDCPLHNDNFRYKATKMPTISVANEEYDGEYRVTTKVNGKATYTDPSDPGFSGKEDITVYGKVKLNGDKMTYDPAI